MHRPPSPVAKMLEGLIELLIELFGNVLLELLFNRATVDNVFAWRTGRWLFIVASAGLLGWASTAVLPRPLIPWTPARATYVLVAPVLIATLLDWQSRRRAAAGRRLGILSTWTDAWLFAFTFSLVRFLVTI